MRRACFAVLIGLAEAASAEPVQYISTGGGLFSYVENRYGAVLTVEDRQPDKFVTDDDAVLRLETGDKLYLGRACDALSREYGEGSWMTSEAGFVVTVGDRDVRFPGQTIPLNTYADCTASADN